VPSVFYSEKSRHFVVIRLAESFLTQRATVKRAQGATHRSKERNRHRERAQPHLPMLYNPVVTACVTELHTGGAVTLRDAPFEVSGCAKKRRRLKRISA
jgi:hypothetical protein